MEIVKPPSEFKRRVQFWFATVVVVACVVAGFFVGLSFIGRAPQQPAPAARRAFPRRAPGEPAVPAPAGPKQEETLVTDPLPSASEPIAPAAEPAPVAAPMTSAPAKHLVVTRPFVDITSSRRKVFFPPQTGAQPAIAQAASPAEPAPQAAPQDSPQPRAAAATAATGYGMATRDQIMGQAAGPVYNLKARSRKASGPAPR
ncbi:MAG: hypothetical protein NTY77_01930 [Elusimicrobia bacterium]|nr:hypothetical protein [Elusimicrobiota bacterium]